MTHPESDRRRFLKMAGTGAVGAGIGSSALVARRASAQDMRTLVVAGDSDIDTLDPQQWQDTYSNIVGSSIFEAMYQWDYFGRPPEPVPDMVPVTPSAWASLNSAPDATRKAPLTNAASDRVI